MVKAYECSLCKKLFRDWHIARYHHIDLNMELGPEACSGGALCKECMQKELKAFLKAIKEDKISI